MDEADLGNDKAEQFIAEALKQARSRSEATPSTGICRSCDVAIEAERLQANPFAQMCQDCAAEAEAANERARRLGT